MRRSHHRCRAAHSTAEDKKKPAIRLTNARTSTGMLRCRAAAVAFTHFLKERGYCKERKKEGTDKGNDKGGDEGAQGDSQSEESPRQVVVFSMGLYEVIWAQYFLVPECVRQVGTAGGVLGCVRLQKKKQTGFGGRFV